MSAVTRFQSRYKAETADLALMGWEQLMQGDAPDWVQALRKRGHEKLCQSGLPTPKLERFKYTNLPAFLKKASLQFAASDIVIDGHTDYVRKLMEHCQEAPEWLQTMATATPAGEDKYGDTMLWDGANAYFNDGITLYVPEKTTGDKPLNITMTGHDGTYFVPRTFLYLEKESDFTVIEYHMGNGSYWNNRVTQIKIEKGARLRHYRFQENSTDSAYTQNTHVQVGEGGQYEAFVLTSGSALSRNQVHVELQGEGAECHLNGINLLSSKQNGDSTLTVEHQAPGCVSKQNYRSVIADQATGTFQGKAHVHRPAQKTDGYQLSNALLLSPQATMNTKPELEIYADDVKCSHGATAGKLDEEALFYLRARGIPEKQARNLLIQAFVGELMEEVSCDDVREQAAMIVSNWLEVRG